jgi:uncharacterized membrane protein
LPPRTAATTDRGRTRRAPIDARSSIGTTQERSRDDAMSDEFAGAPSTPAPERSPELRQLRLADIVRWLAAGWRDFREAPAVGLFYGTCFVLMGWALLAIYRNAPIYVLTLAAGFLLAGPFVCIGLYRTSQQIERGRHPQFGEVTRAWRRRTGPLAIFGFALLVLEMLWGRVALVVFAVSFDGMPDFQGSLLKLLDPANIGFIVAYLASGALFAGLIFAMSAISIPMILDRPVDSITAALASMRLVFGQPGVMLAWGATITVLLVLAMLPGFLGLLVVGPVVGHASWHAYRSATDPARSIA